MKKEYEFITTSDYMLVAWSKQNNDLTKLGSIDALGNFVILNPLFLMSIQILYAVIETC